MTRTDSASATRWFVIAVCASFAAGATVGVLLPGACSTLFAQPVDGSTDPYVRRLVETYALDTDQEGKLELIHRHRELQRTSIFEEERQRLPDPIRQRLDARLDRLSERTNRRIEYILNPDQLARWRRDLQPMTLDPSVPGGASDGRGGD